MYPYFLPSDLRMTRPTACTISTGDLRGAMKNTASSAGTSTPSERQRALLRIRQTPLSLPLNQSMRPLRSSALCCPSTCRVQQRNAPGRRSLGSIATACSTTPSQCFSNRLEARMVLAKAMARERGRTASPSADVPFDRPELTEASALPPPCALRRR